MIHVPALRWGKPYKSLDSETLVHFDTGEDVAEVSQVNAGIVRRDLRKTARAREALLEIPAAEIVKRVQNAVELYENGSVAIGDAEQTPDDFVRQQSSTTGMPEALCRFNMGKISYVLRNMDKILDALTRGLDLDFLTQGWGVDGDGRLLSYQAETDVLGMVLPSNSPGVHTLWIPAIPMQVGLVLKPGSAEPWTAYRMASAMIQSGIPGEAISLYPGSHEVGQAIMAGAGRSMIFGGQATVDQYSGDPKIQVHGPGYSKILIGEDQADNWEDLLDMMELSVAVNSGRGCINCSTILTPRHGRAIAEALGERLAKWEARAHDDPEAKLAAFTTKGVAAAVSGAIDADLSSGAEDVCQTIRGSERLIEREHCDYLLPTVVYADSVDHPVVKKEYMFPFVSVAECPQDQMLDKIGYTLVGTGITEDEDFQRQLIASREIDRLNLGAIATTKLDWLQPHEGNIVEFLYRARSFQQVGAA